MSIVDKYYGVASYDGKPVWDMSEIELKGLLITLVSDYNKEELISLVNKVGNTFYCGDRR